MIRRGARSAAGSVTAGVLALVLSSACQSEPAADQPMVLDGMTHPCDLVDQPKVSAILDRTDLNQVTVSVPADTVFGSVRMSSLDPPFTPRELAAKCIYQTGDGEPILELSSTRFYGSLDEAAAAAAGPKGKPPVPLTLEGADEAVSLRNPSGVPVVLALVDGTLYAGLGSIVAEVEQTQDALSLLLAAAAAGS